MLHSLDYYLHAKNLRDCRIFSKDIDDQRILQSDWKSNKTSHTKAKLQIWGEWPSGLRHCNKNR